MQESMWTVIVLTSKIITTVHNNLCIIKTDTTKQHLLNNQDNVQPSMICLFSVKLFYNKELLQTLYTSNAIKTNVLAKHFS